MANEKPKLDKNFQFQNNVTSLSEDTLNPIINSLVDLMEKPEPQFIQKDTAMNWQIQNPILPAGVFGYETTRRVYKAGIGQNWNDTPYLSMTPINPYVPFPPSQGLHYDSWETIAQISQLISMGNINPHDPHQNPYSIGDQKTITLTNGEQITLEIWGFNHDDKSDGSGKAGITFGMRDLMARARRFNSALLINGWNTSEFRNSTLPTILAVLPNDVASVIKEVTKNSISTGITSGVEPIIQTNDKLFLPAAAELVNVPGVHEALYAQEGHRYEFYRSIATTAQSRIKKSANGTGSEWIWMTRSMSFSPWEHNVVSFSAAGQLTSMQSHLLAGICFGFCV